MEPVPDESVQRQPEQPIVSTSAAPPATSEPTPVTLATPQPIIISPTQPVTPAPAASSTFGSGSTAVSATVSLPADNVRPSGGETPVPAVSTVPLAAPQPGSPVPPPDQFSQQPPLQAELPPAPQPFQAAPNYGQVSAATAQMPSPHMKSRKKWVLFGGIAVLLLAAGWVFGFYLPNTPSNVYNTVINRSGKALSSLVDSATTKQKIEALKTSKISGSVTARIAGDTYSGDFNTTFDQTNLTGGFDINLQSKAAGKESLNAKVMSQTAAGSLYPDIYFQLNGLKALGADQYAPGISNYDGKWIAVDAKYLQSLGDAFVPIGQGNDAGVTAADIAEVARASMAVTQQYVFSTAADKSVFVKKSFVGKEKADGLNTYHYKVGLNKAHVQAYCSAVSDAVLSTNAYKKLSGQKDSDIASEKKDAAKSCAESAKAIKASDTYDMWVDSKYKLIYKFRIYDSSDKGSYTDIGQIYKGGDALTVFAANYDATDKINTKFTLNTDVKTYATQGTLTVKSINSDDPFDVTATIKASAGSGKVQITKPTDSVPIQQVLTALGLNSDATAVPGGSLQSQAQDTKRKTDINTLESEIEAYYAEHGYYPQREQLSDPSWRKANMEGLDGSAVTPPNSTATGFAAGAPTASQYGYNPTSCDVDGCQGFTISAMLSDGTIYSKQDQF